MGHKSASWQPRRFPRDTTRSKQAELPSGTITMGAVARGGGGNKRGKITALAIIEVFTKTWERRPLPNEEAPKERGENRKMGERAHQQPLPDTVREGGGNEAARITQGQSQSFLTTLSGHHSSLPKKVSVQKHYPEAKPKRPQAQPTSTEGNDDTVGRQRHGDVRRLSFGQCCWFPGVH